MDEGIDVLTVLVSVITAAFAGVIATASTIYINRRDRRHDLVITQLRDATESVAANAREILHLSTSGSSSRENRLKVESRDLAQLAVRVGTDTLRLVGDADVQRAARLVRRHVHALVQFETTGQDPRAEYGYTPYSRLEGALDYLVTESRRQLGLVGAGDTDIDFAVLTKSIMEARNLSD